MSTIAVIYNLTSDAITFIASITFLTFRTSCTSVTFSTGRYICINLNSAIFVINNFSVLTIYDIGVIFNNCFSWDGFAYAIFRCWSIFYSSCCASTILEFNDVFVLNIGIIQRNWCHICVLSCLVTTDNPVVISYRICYCI